MRQTVGRDCRPRGHQSRHIARPARPAEAAEWL